MHESNRPDRRIIQPPPAAITDGAASMGGEVQRPDEVRPESGTASVVDAPLGRLPETRVPDPNRRYPDRPAASHAGSAAVERVAHRPDASAADGDEPTGHTRHVPAPGPAAPVPAETTLPTAGDTPPADPPDRGGPPPDSRAAGEPDMPERPESLALFDARVAAEIPPTAQDGVTAEWTRESVERFVTIVGDLFQHPDQTDISARTPRGAAAVQEIIRRHMADRDAVLPQLLEAIVRGQDALVYAREALDRPVLITTHAEPMTMDALNLEASTGEPPATNAPPIGDEHYPVSDTAQAGGYIGPDGEWEVVNANLTQRQRSQTIDGKPVVTTETFVHAPIATVRALAICTQNLSLYTAILAGRLGVDLEVHTDDSGIPAMPPLGNDIFMTESITSLVTFYSPENFASSRIPIPGNPSLLDVQEPFARYTRAIENAALPESPDDTKFPALERYQELTYYAPPNSERARRHTGTIKEWVKSAWTIGVTPITGLGLSEMNKQTTMDATEARGAVDRQLADLPETLSILSECADGLAFMSDYIELTARRAVVHTQTEMTLTPGDPVYIGQFNVMVTAPDHGIIGRREIDPGQLEFELFQRNDLAILTHPAGTSRYRLEWSDGVLHVTHSTMHTTGNINTRDLNELQLAFTQYVRLLETANTPGADINALRPQLEAETTRLFGLISGDDPDAPPPEGREHRREPLRAVLQRLFNYTDAVLAQKPNTSNE